MTKQNKAYLLAGTAVFMWSTVGTAFKLTLSSLHPVIMLLYASLVSIIVLFTILLIQGKLSLLLQVSRKDLLRSALNALLNPLLFYVVLFFSYDMLLTQEAMVINFTWPLPLTLLSILILKQNISLKSVLAILISFLGIVVIATKGDILALHFENPAGVLLALSSTIIWSFFWIVNIRDKRDEVIKLFLNFSFGSIYVLLVAVFFKLPFTLSFNALLGIGYIGIFEMGVAYVLWLKGLQLSETTAKVSNLLFIAPFFSLIFINIFVGERILWSTLAGLAFVVTGIIMQRHIK
ncbi:MAG TPA: DMT family transporter [Bacteroidales bacterium]|nr:DMT family transporter [Bacteroidales bacterium]HPI85196.1 DMT family transporter [Bacteroidales bacterium]